MTWNSWIVFELPKVSSARLGYDATLAMARRAFRREAWSEAEALLMQAGVIAGNDPAFFNLVGILREVQGNKNAAASFYGKAIRADSDYAPAQQNMRRLYELRTFGHTRQIVSLGDERQMPEMD
jgi:Flp pilus assembly protein TadD